MALASTASTVYVVCNIYPHLFIKDYQISFNDILVDDLLEDILKERSNLNPEASIDVSAHQLRIVTDLSAAFPLPQDSYTSPLDAKEWYENNGWYISSGFLAKYGEQATLGQLAEKDESVANLFEQGQERKVVLLYVIAVEDEEQYTDTRRYRFLTPPTESNGVISAQQLYLKNVAEIDISPSSAVENLQNYLAAQDQANIVFWQWSGDNTGPSPLLYEPAFAHAEQDLHDLSRVQLDPDILGLTRRLCRTLSKLYDNDAIFREAIHPKLQELFEIPDADFKLNVCYMRGGYKGGWTEIDHMARCMTPIGIPAPYIIVQVRTCRPDVHADVQAAFSLRRLILTSEFRQIPWISCVPCLIVGASGGPELTFRRAYFTDALYAEPMDMVTMCDTGPVRMMQLARQLQVYRNIARELRTSYAKIHVGSPISHTPWLFPRPIYVRPSPKGRLRILDRVKPFVGSRALFTGTYEVIADGQDSPTIVAVHIKFTYRYGFAVHHFLANHGYAPRILYHGQVEDGSRMQMVVMESINAGRPLSRRDGPLLEEVEKALNLLCGEAPEKDNTTLAEPAHSDSLSLAQVFDSENRVLREASKPAPPEDSMDMSPRPVKRAQLESLSSPPGGLRLHEKKPTVASENTLSIAKRVVYVHGDLRAQNIVVVDSDPPRVYLVDFDLAGEEGQVVYPELNLPITWTAPGADENELILHSHDRFMLNRLRSWCAGEIDEEV